MNEDSESIDFESRKLCPNGECTGVLDAKGNCPECGGGVSGSRSGSGTETETASPFEDDRRLCPDGACVGVIGADGKCKVCGRSE